MSEPFKKYSNDPNFHGYPLFYVVEGECLCFDCCNAELNAGNEYFTPIDHPATNNKEYNEEISENVNWEDPNLWCNQCSEKIEGAYLEDEDEDEDEGEDNGISN